MKVVLATDHSVVSGRWGQRQKPPWAHLEGREEEGGEAEGCRGWGRAAAGMLQLLFSKAAPRVPGLRLLADLIRCDKAA